MGFISDLGDTIESLGETAAKVGASYEKYQAQRDAQKAPENPRFTVDQLEYELYRRRQEQGTMPSGPEINEPQYAGFGGGGLDSGAMVALAGLGLIGLAVYVGS